MITMNTVTPIPMPMLAPVLRARVESEVFTGGALSAGLCGMSAVASGIDGVEIGSGASNVVVTASFTWTGYESQSLGFQC
jgi:hypothetical protein